MKTNKSVTQRQAAKIIADLNAIVEACSHGSALRGLTVTASCFAALLDVYAQPNEQNPEGMCDDLQAFRHHFANVITTTPVLRKKVRAHA
jgi:hypothetical protein